MFKKKKTKDLLLKCITYTYTTIAVIILLYPVFWTMGTSLKEDYEIAKASLNFTPPMPKQMLLNIDYTSYVKECGDKGVSAGSMMSEIEKDMAFISTQLALSIDRDSIFGFRINAIDGGKSVASLDIPKYIPKYIGRVVVLHWGNRINPARLMEDWERIKGFYKFKDYSKEPVNVSISSYTTYTDEVKVEKSLKGVNLPALGTVEYIGIKNDPLRFFDNLYAAVLRFSGTGFSVNKISSGIGRYTLNTIMLSGIAIVGSILINGLAGYALSKLINRRLSEILMIFFTATIMLPGMLILIPVYLMYSNWGLLNTYWALILPLLLDVSAFWIYLFKGFFGTLPNDVFDSARIDGAGEWKVFLKVCVPLSKSIISVLVMYVFLGVWNNFFWPFLAVNDEKYYTIPLMLYKYRLPDQGGQSQSIIMSLYTLIAIPCLLILLLFNKYIEKGIVFTGLKG